MSVPAEPYAGVAAPQRAAMSMVASALVALGVFLSGFVMREPAPYELFIAVLMTLWAIFGMRISRQVAPLLVLLIVFNIGGMVSLLTMATLEDAPLYIAVSLFLGLSAVFFAAIVEADWRRLRLIFRAYLGAALVTAGLGILGYFDMIPGGEAYTRYGRAMGAFQDPNVFGPFLVLPALYLLHGVLTGSAGGLAARLPALAVLTLGIFLSFSRAAWGLYVLTVAMLVLALLLERPSGRFRLRVMAMALAGLAVLTIVLIGALQIPEVAELFRLRAQLVQDYDAGAYGRFQRHLIGFAMALTHPFGIGPLVFGQVLGEDTHNIWLKALLDYGWLGFFAWMVLTVWTLVLGFRLLLRARPWQPYLLIAYIVFIGHLVIGNVIDIDHWRHFYLVTGLIWGAAALEARHGRPIWPVPRPGMPEEGRRAARSSR